MILFTRAYNVSKTITLYTKDMQFPTKQTVSKPAERENIAFSFTFVFSFFGQYTLHPGKLSHSVAFGNVNMRELHLWWCATTTNIIKKENLNQENPATDYRVAKKKEKKHRTW